MRLRIWTFVTMVVAVATGLAAFSGGAFSGLWLADVAFIGFTIAFIACFVTELVRSARRLSHAHEREIHEKLRRRTPRQNDTRHIHSEHHRVSSSSECRLAR